MVRLSSAAGRAAIRISPPRRGSVAGAPRTWRYYGRHLPSCCAAVPWRCSSWRWPAPRTVEYDSRTNAERASDIVLAIDVSGSMLAPRLPARPHHGGQGGGRLRSWPIASATASAWWFSRAKPTPRALTTDKGTLQTLLGRARSGLVEDGTAIGNGLATAINRLRESDAKSKVVILLTDGENNAGQIAPLTAAGIAEAQGIRVYTIGVGTQGKASPIPSSICSVRSPTAWPR